MGPWAHMGPGPSRARAQAGPKPGPGPYGSEKMSLFGDLSINGCGQLPSGGKTSSENDPSKEFKRLGAQKCPFSEI